MSPTEREQLAAKVLEARHRVDRVDRAVLLGHERGIVGEEAASLVDDLLVARGEYHEALGAYGARFG